MGCIGFFDCCEARGSLIYCNGCNFSIADFKTVKFKIKNIPNPELLTKATVYIFGKDDRLILNEQINISISK